MLSARPDQAPSLSSPGDVNVDLSCFVLPELLLSVFDWLPQKDLLSAAAVCHRWRALVLAHSNLFYHLALVFDMERDNMKEWVPVHRFCAGLRYLRERNLRASVAVDWTKIMPTVEETNQAGTTQLQVAQPTASSMAVMSASVFCRSFCFTLRILEEWLGERSARLSTPTLRLARCVPKLSTPTLRLARCVPKTGGTAISADTPA